MAAFAEIGVMPEIIRSLDELGWQLPTPIQQEAIPLILGGGDVLGAAETGTGKTGAFGIPVLQLIHEQLRQEALESSEAVGGKQNEIARKEIRMSLEDKEALFTPDTTGLVCCVMSKTAWGGGRSSAGVIAGRYYYEVICERMCEKESTARVGFSTAAGSHALGTCPNGYGFGSTGKKSNSSNFTGYGDAFGEGDVVGCMLDLGGRSVSFSLNGLELGEAFSIPSHLQRAGFYASACLKAATVRLNFGGAPTRFGPPPGFVWMGKAEAKDTVSMEQGTADDAKGATPLCVILEPSRDLAEQTFRCLVDFKRHMAAPGVEAVLLVGGVDLRDNVRALQGGAHVVVGTPGRVEELVTCGKLSCRRVKYLVLDEADRLLETGNRATIMNIFGRLRKDAGGDRRLQVLLFSATLHSPEIRELSEVLCQHPTWVDLKGADYVPQTVHHLVVEVCRIVHAATSLSDVLLARLGFTSMSAVLLGSSLAGHLSFWAQTLTCGLGCDFDGWTGLATDRHE